MRGMNGHIEGSKKKYCLTRIYELVLPIVMAFMASLFSTISIVNEVKTNIIPTLTGWPMVSLSLLLIAFLVGVFKFLASFEESWHKGVESQKDLILIAFKILLCLSFVIFLFCNVDKIAIGNSADLDMKQTIALSILLLFIFFVIYDGIMLLLSSVLEKYISQIMASNKLSSEKSVKYESIYNLCISIFTLSGFVIGILVMK